MKELLFISILFTSLSSFAGREGNAGGERYIEFSRIFNETLRIASARPEILRLIEGITIDFTCEEFPEGVDCLNYPEEKKIICNERNWVRHYDLTYAGRKDRATLVLHEVFSIHLLERSGNTALADRYVQIAENNFHRQRYTLNNRFKAGMIETNKFYCEE